MRFDYYYESQNESSSYYNAWVMIIIMNKKMNQIATIIYELWLLLWIENESSSYDYAWVMIIIMNRKWIK